MAGNETHDVVIIGGGIAGSALATVLARAGADVLLLEKSATFTDHVRGEAILQWGVKEAQGLGLLDGLIAAGGHFLSRGVGYDELNSPEMAEAAPTDMAQFLPGVPGILAIGHPQHCQALLDQAQAAGAKARRGIELTAVEAGVSPSVTFSDGETEITARARLVVGADGRNSEVREALRTPLTIGPPRTLLSGMLIDGATGWDADSWMLGTENDLCFAVFPQGSGRARIYGWWRVSQRKRFAGPDGAAAFLAAFKLECCPKSGAIAGARPAGPLITFLNNETEAETPFMTGGVLIGDAAGWTDPLSGCGLSSAYRDARVVSEILLASDDWSPAAFAPYGEERRERLRRLRFVTEIESALFCDFEERGRARRRQFNARMATEPAIAAHVLANLAGPESQPAEAYTPAHRAFVLGEA
ncbi:MAG TPA: NAD(P)/FAD-dependent oxidoreductase [Caulobacteraceae bacterium]|jgi:2-polyprenyl-6-methoxyphenol hydroxylase-like FAD-dependent oxidoreductase|nr:NAD(P)/FAD-dependent oxidoreductase [Caulobacteraceae bacterium]